MFVLEKRKRYADNKIFRKYVFSVFYGCSCLTVLANHTATALEKEMSWRIAGQGAVYYSSSSAAKAKIINDHQSAPPIDPNQECVTQTDSYSTATLENSENTKKISVRRNYTWLNCPWADPQQSFEAIGTVIGDRLTPFVQPNPTNGDDCPSSENPISFAKGNKFYQFNDYQGGGIFPLSFTRYYNSQHYYILGSNNYVPRWSHSYDRRLTKGDNDDQVVVWRPAGKSYVFNWDGNKWASTYDKSSRLIKYTDTNGDVTKWEYIGGGDVVEEYDPDGRLQVLTHSSGVTHRFTYNLMTQPVPHDSQADFHSAPILNNNYDRITVDDSRGQTLVIDFRFGVFSKLTDPDNNVTEYIFVDEDTPIMRLKEVIFPDGNSNAEDNAKHIFHYTDADLPMFFTEIRDENNDVLFAVTYDHQTGRALTSELANGAEKTTVVYNPDNSRTVTNALGKVTRYYYQNNQNRFIRAEGDATDNCAASSKYVVYKNGTDRQVAARTDWEGNITYYERDDKGRVTKEEKGHGWSGAPQSGYVANIKDFFAQEATLPSPLVITETCWHPTLNKIERTIEENRVTRYTYSTEGLLLTKKVEPRSAGNESCN